jgi:hypothetical protein
MDGGQDMAWIEVHQKLWIHPKTIAFAKALKIDPVYAGGLLCRLWCWAIDAADEDGNIGYLPMIEIATAAGWRKSAKSFFCALTTVHEGCTSAWVDDLGNGVYRLHDWDTYTGKLQERRRKDRTRKVGSNSDGNSKGKSTEIPKENPRKNYGIPDATVPYRTNIPPIVPQEGTTDTSSESLTEKRFEEFWKIYPLKIGKQAALRAFKKIKPTADLHSKILSAIEKAKKSDRWQRENGQFIPHPTTWLNQGRWDDEIEPEEPSKYKPL